MLMSKTTNEENIKTWDSLKENDYFYVYGVDNNNNKYEYISQIKRKNYTSETSETSEDEGKWVCTDIWDKNLDNLEDGWVMEKGFFIKEHLSFHKINPVEFPEYFL